MTCHDVQNRLSFYLYGELDFAREEELERHLFECAFCQDALAREKAWHATLRSEVGDPAVELLTDCRRELNRNLARFRGDGAPKVFLWRRVMAWMDVPVMDWAARGALACFLVILGFGLGRWAERGQPVEIPQAGLQFAPANVLSTGTHIRQVRATDPGQVRIVLEQVREGEILGRLDDSRIRNYVLTASQRSADPAVRVDSVQALAGQSGLDVRDVLLSSVRHDPNAAVRLKALEALRAFGRDPATRQTLRYVLQNDANPGVRSEAINVLLPATEAVELSPELMNTLQDVVRSEQVDDYVRMRCLRILQATGGVSNTY